MKTRLLIAVFFLLLIFCPLLLRPVQVPPLQGRVNDLAGILSAAEKSELEQLLQSVENKNSSQLVLLIVQSLDGEPIENFAIQVAEKWKIGQKGLDNGAIILISMGERKIRIEVGYGLEAILTDAKCFYIIQEMIIPEFKAGRYSQGIRQGLDTIAKIVSREFDISPEELKRFQQKQKKANRGHIPVVVIFIIIIIVLNLFKKGSGFSSGGPFYMGGGGGGFFSGGSSGGGGFSGGGGSFGGGGSSGSW